MRQSNPRAAPSRERKALYNDQDVGFCRVGVENRWDEKAGLRRDAVRSQVIDAL